MKKIYLLLIPALVSLVGCTAQSANTAIAGTNLLADVMSIDVLLESGQVEQTVLSIEYPADQQASLEAAMATYEAHRMSIEAIGDDPLAVLRAVPAVRTIHDSLLSTYLQVQAIVDVHWEEYAPEDQARLILWRDRAYRLEQTYQTFLTEFNNQVSAQAQQQAAVELATTVARIALMAAI